MDHNQINQEIIKNFHIFWNNFPAPVLLLHKDRTIIAGNKAADLTGAIPGTRCCDQGPKEAHKKCLANIALKENKAQRLVDYSEMMGMVIDSYWIPVDGEPDLYVHFGIDITPYASENKFPQIAQGL